MFLLLMWQMTKKFMSKGTNSGVMWRRKIVRGKLAKQCKAFLLLKLNKAKRTLIKKMSQTKVKVRMSMRMVTN